MDLRNANKKLSGIFFLAFPAFYFLKVHLHNFSKKKIIRSNKTAEIKVFITIFLDDRRIRIRITVSLTDGCGSGWPNNILILRIRIRNTAKKSKKSVDLFRGRWLQYLSYLIINKLISRKSRHALSPTTTVWPALLPPWHLQKKAQHSHTHIFQFFLNILVNSLTKSASFL